MADRGGSLDRSISPTLEREIDDLCLKYERDWQAKRNPRIEDYVARVPDDAKPVALRELIFLELDLHRAAGEGVDPREYHARFLENSQEVDAAFALFRRSDKGDSVQQDTDSFGSRMISDTDDIRSLPSPETDLPERIARYRVERLLGQGGFGRVFLAHDDQLQRPVAVKVPHARLVSRAEDAEAYLAEARALASLEHPHIVPVYDVGGTEEFPCYFVMKYVEGTKLTALLDEGPPEYATTVEIVVTVADALHYAHKRGLVHRDIKPGNILLDQEGRPFVVDFGLALLEQDVGRGSQYVGTPAYMSPEQARGEGHRVDGRSDIYSLGAVLYEMLTNRKTFKAESQEELLEVIACQEPKPPRQIDDGIPKELERICLKALSGRVSERYTVAKDMAEDLRHFLTSDEEADRAAPSMPDQETPDVGINQIGNINPLLKPIWRYLDDDLRQVLAVAATIAQLECKNYVSTTNFVKALMVLKPGRISDFFSRLPDGALSESIPGYIPTQLSALQTLDSFSPCINSAMSTLTPEVSRGEALSSEDVYIDIARYATGKSTQRLRSHGVSKTDVEKIVAQLGWQLIERNTAITE